MDWLAGACWTQAIVFVLVAARVAGVAMLAPIFSSVHVPIRIRLALILLVALPVTPLVAQHSAVAVASLPDFVVVLGVEALLGATLGLATALLLAGIQLAGQFVGQLSGLALADLFDPEMETGTPLLSRLLELTGLATFVLIGGHRLMIKALLDTFTHLPPGGVSLPTSIADALATLLSESFGVGVRIALPAVTALLLASLLVAIVSRTLPQLNSMSLGLGINSVLGLGTFAMSLAAVAWMLEEQLEPMLDLVVAAWHG